MSDQCKMTGCENPRRTKGDRYGEDNQFAVSAFGSKFCSQKCELKYEHIRADARDAKRSVEHE